MTCPLATPSAWRTPASGALWAQSWTPIDNALAATIIGLFKTGVIPRNGPWRSIDEVENVTRSWVDWFNKRSLLEPIGDAPLAEYESEFDRAQSSTAKVLGLNRPNPRKPGRFK